MFLVIEIFYDHDQCITDYATSLWLLSCCYVGLLEVIKWFSRIPQNPPLTQSNLLSVNCEHTFNTYQLTVADNLPQRAFTSKDYHTVGQKQQCRKLIYFVHFIFSFHRLYFHPSQQGMEKLAPKTPEKLKLALLLTSTCFTNLLTSSPNIPKQILPSSIAAVSSDWSILTPGAINTPPLFHRLGPSSTF